MRINMDAGVLKRVLDASPSRVLSQVELVIRARPNDGLAIYIYNASSADRELIEAILAAASPGRLTDVDPTG